jgi:hypothetical protein
MPGGPFEDDWSDAAHIVELIHGDTDSLDKYLRQASNLVKRLAPLIHAVAVEPERTRKLEYVEILNLIPLKYGWTEYRTPTSASRATQYPGNGAACGY